MKFKIAPQRKLIIVGKHAVEFDFIIIIIIIIYLLKEDTIKRARITV